MAAILLIALLFALVPASTSRLALRRIQLPDNVSLAVVEAELKSAGADVLRCVTNSSLFSHVITS